VPLYYEKTELLFCALESQNIEKRHTGMEVKRQIRFELQRNFQRVVVSTIQLVNNICANIFENSFLVFEVIFRIDSGLSRMIDS
jgi:hypothetical protein